MLFDLSMWLMYFPVRYAAQLAGGGPRLITRTADLLAEVELRAFRRRNLVFQEYLAHLLRSTALEGSKSELTKACLRYRHRRSLGMNIEQPSTLRIPDNQS